MIIKGISLWEPWASLIATGAKKFETRCWHTNYRGPLLICASKVKVDYTSGQHLADYLFDGDFQGGLAPLVGLPLKFNPPRTFDAGVRPEHLRYGLATSLAILTDCIPTENLTVQQIGTDLPFGDFRRLRFAWKLDHVKRIPFDFPVKGKQMLFDVYIDEVRIERFIEEYLACWKEKGHYVHP